MKIINSNYIKHIIALFFAIIYAAISLVNHYNFRTCAWDLGLFNNALFDYAHFKLNDYTLLNENFPNPLGDHFALMTVLLSPLYWFFGSYTMLVAQIGAIIFGGYGIHTYFKNKAEQPFFSEFAMFHFYSIWGIYSALSYDFHDNVLAAMFVPWLFYYFQIRKFIAAGFFLALILISKENMALWSTFICVGIALMNYKDKTKFKLSFIFASISLLYFFVVVKLVMPIWAGNAGQNGYMHFKYAALGPNGVEAVKTILTKPLYVIKLLFESHLSDPMTFGIKGELHFMVIVSGGFALFFKPQYLFMLIPIYAQKLFSDDFGKWGLNHQYSIEFVPLITIAFFNWTLNLKSSVLKWVFITNVLTLTVYSTYLKLDNRKSLWYNQVASQFYNQEHYKRSFNVQKVNEGLQLIPDSASVSAQSPLVPHLSFRDSIFLYPRTEKVSYIALLNTENTFPLSREQYDEMLKGLLNNFEWKCIYKQDSLYIFKRGSEG